MIRDKYKERLMKARVKENRMSRYQGSFVREKKFQKKCFLNLKDSLKFQGEQKNLSTQGLGRYIESWNKNFVIKGYKILVESDDKESFK